MKPPINNSTATPTEHQPRIAGFYARVSTARQENEETIESQVDEVKRRIAADGNILPEENIFIDDGWSGEILARPCLDLLRDAAEAKKFQVLYVYDRGRLSREFYQQELIINELKDLWIEFISLHDTAAHTPEEMVLQAMQGVFAQYERIKIAERFRRGRLYKAKNGVLINGQVPYGYTRIKKTDTSPAYVIINEEQAQVVRMMFSWYANEGCSLHEIARRLYKLGIAPQKKKSERWTKGPIERLLKSETYFDGFIYYNKSEAVVPRNPTNKSKYKKIKKSSRRGRPREEWLPYQVPKIIDDPALYAKAHKRFELNKKFARKNQKYEYLLTGLAWCSDCGYRRVGDMGGNHNHYYRCAQRVYKEPVPTECFAPGVNAVAVDIAFWDKFEAFMKNPELSREHAETYVRQRQTNPVLQQEQLQLQRSLTNLAEEEQRYIRAFGAGTLSEQQFQEMMKEVKKRRALWQQQLADVTKRIEQHDVDPIHVDELIAKVKEMLQSVDLTIKRQVIQDVISKVVISKELVDVYGKVTQSSTSWPLTVGLKNENRDRWFAKRGEVDIV